MNYFIQCITKKYADFSGRARRAEYWYFTLWYALLLFALMFTLGFIVGALGGTDESAGTLASIVSNIISLALLLPSLGVAIRRLHDIGKSGWWILIAFIPILGAIILLIFMVTPGNAGSNQYGPDPKSNS